MEDALGETRFTGVRTFDVDSTELKRSSSIGLGGMFSWFRRGNS